jgi:triose/dihydroxyacetone kinase / FAD-AMP lyase (cyclizing)
MKKLINSPERVVREMLEGLLALYPNVALLGDHNVLIRSDIEDVCDRQVGIISGGGSGHEPAHAGYVGSGMLSAAVAGEIFTSPSMQSVLAAIKAAAAGPGTLLIVKNYTGDRLNFGVAAEIARSDGMLVDTVIVSDDVALAGAQATRRGIAGTVLVHKIAGAAASEGKDLPQIASLARAVVDDIGTMGVSLSAGSSPVSGKLSFELGEEIEMGLGIHGEPGVRRVPLQPADYIVDELANNIISTLQLRWGERVVVLINNLGDTTHMELAIVARRALSTIESFGLIVERLYSGTFVSSLDMAGVSISLMRVDDERLRLLDAPTAAPAWPNAPTKPPGAVLDRMMVSGAVELPFIHALAERRPGEKMRQAMTAGCTAIIQAQSRLGEMDRIVGDGDLGLNLARGARAVLGQMKSAFDSASLGMQSSSETLKALGLSLQASVGGSSGPLYGVWFLRTGSALENVSEGDPKAWARAMLEGCEAISELGGARLGDRTMLDALIPFAQSFDRELEAGAPVKNSLFAAVAAAEAGAEETAKMIARRGRSSYLGDRILGTIDPGAMAVAIVLRAIASVFS